MNATGFDYCEAGRQAKLVIDGYVTIYLLCMYRSKQGTQADESHSYILTDMDSNHTHLETISCGVPRTSPSLSRRAAQGTGAQMTVDAIN